MGARPHDEDAAPVTPEPGAVEGAPSDEGGELIPAFGKEALISIGLFIAFVLFVVICLPTYIL